MIFYENSYPTRIVYGQGTHHQIGERLAKMTDKVLMIYGGGSIKRTGLYDDTVNSLKENRIEFKELSGVMPNPTLAKVNEGIRICREYGIRFLLAVGGGSVIDTAKGIAMGVDYEGSVWDFYTGTKLEKALPVATILTIPGTGSETSVNVVLTNEETQEKIGLASDVLRPVLSILDPTLCTTVPQSQIAPGIYDMFSHTEERYFCNTIHCDLSDEVAEGVMRAIIKNGLEAYRDKSDVDAWGELMAAADYSHNGMTGFGREGDWANHGMEEVISGIYNIPHGAGLSIITPAWMKYVYKKHIPMFVQFAVNVMGVRGSFREPEKLALAGIEALEEWSRKLGLPTRLSEVGIDDSKFEFMAKRCAGYHKNGLHGKMEKLTWEDIVEIYKLAL